MPKRTKHSLKAQSPLVCEIEAKSREIAKQKMADWFRRADCHDELSTAYDRVQP